MKWLEVKVKTTSENEEIVSDILYKYGTTGLAIEDPNDIVEFSRTEKDWDFIDSSLINTGLDGIIIKAYYSDGNDKIEFIRAEIEKDPVSNGGRPYGEVIITEVDEDDWAENWKKYYKPTRIGNRLVIKPSWEEFDEEPGDILIELDPGMAFGTGTHETTALCSEALEAYVTDKSIVFDIGCGSGILSIVAAKLGAEKVTAIDLDSMCVKVSKENIEINNVSQIVKVEHGNLLDIIEGKANIIVANIIAEVIAGLTNDLSNYLEPNGIFIASGIILEKIKLVEEALLDNNFKIVDIKTRNSWACIIATK